MSRQRAVRNRGVIAAARWRRPREPEPRLMFQVDPWSRKLVRPLLITLLATSVAIAMLVIVRLSSPEQGWMALVPLCFIIALEGTLTTAWLNNPDSNGVDRGVYRAAEILLILVVARIYSWTFFGTGIPSPDEMRLYLTSPVAIFSVGGFVTSALVVLAAWGLAVHHTRIFSRLDVSIYEINFYTLSPTEQKEMADNRPIQKPRDQLLHSYLSSWLTGGMLMVILAALSTFEVREFTSVTNPFEFTRLGLGPGMLYALMIYFLAGFWLLSHARLLRMNARWLMDGVAKEAGLERHWQRTSLFILLLIALVAAFLPIGSTLAISRILTVGLSGAAYLVSVVGSLFGYLVASALLLLTRSMGEIPQEQTELVPQMPVAPPITPAGEPNPLVTMVISSAFWALIVAILIAALLFFLRERGYAIDKGRVRNSWAVVVAWLREVWQRLTGRLRTAGRDMRARLRVPDTIRSSSTNVNISPPRFLRLGALSPREQIRYYYLALVRRAAERGVGRRDSETPLEYAQDLKEAWPEAEGDLEELTQAFLEARYSPQPIEKAHAHSIKERWGALKTSLRAGRK